MLWRTRRLDFILSHFSVFFNRHLNRFRFRPVHANGVSVGNEPEVTDLVVAIPRVRVVVLPFCVVYASSVI